MTDEQFWSELEKIAKKGINDDTVQEFADMLMYGYRNDLLICEIGVLNQSGHGFVNQLYTGSFDNRLMYCSTTFENGKLSVLNMDKAGKLDVPYDTEITVTAVPCKFILDNLFFKEQISALIFDEALDSRFTVPASILRPMIEAEGKAKLPEHFMSAEEEKPLKPLIKPFKKRSELLSPVFNDMSVRDWAVRKSPPAYFTILLSDKWDYPYSEEHASKIFCAQWGNVRKYIEKQNKKSGKKLLDDYTIEHKDADVSEDLTLEFINILNNIDLPLSNTHRYKELIGFCKDMLELFENTDEKRNMLLGIIGESMWKLDPPEGEKFFKEHLQEYNEKIMAFYSFQLLKAERWDDAKEALKGYEDSEDEVIRDRFEWLKERP